MSPTTEPWGYHIFTYGCQMNVRDSEIMAGLLNSQGGTLQNQAALADLIIFNTCSVRHSAENKVYGKLGEYLKIKNSRPGMIIAFGGCMAQIPEVVNRVKRMGVDIVFGTHNLHLLPQLIERHHQGHKKVVEVWPEHGEIIEALPSQRNPGWSAFVNIMYGCNNYCSYCIVPYTRGRERSRRPQDILAELQALAADGFKEVTLLGQNVNSYGQGLPEAFDFADLLAMADSIPGLERIRFTTSHPKDMSDKLIDTIAGGRNLCEHIHVPLQAGSNEVLKRMNRHYSREHYLEMVAKIRERIPGVAISSDLIVGFPGETQADFEETLEMVEKVRFDSAFTFMYSTRTGTQAAKLPDQIDLRTKRERLLRLNQLQYAIAAEINRGMEGKIEEIMVEGPSKTDYRRMTGRTRTNRIVIFEGCPDLAGELLRVKITKGNTFSLFGEAADGKSIMK
ncbi:MAG: tRNA (N6-isopentenyl adenosine(37)-C2)-methylthiotransferase MiaB [Syntrophomonadaceae bacterium]|nr:tRNA (N6-isopentenyl adenosine(37)-C2)-methylthiotransferase MiaB [Syntrophomonadaceae bacterium]